MTDAHDAVAPHAAAEQDPRDPSRAANQIRTDSEHPVDEDLPAAHTNDPDRAGGEPSGSMMEPDRPQAGVPEQTVTDTTSTLGTSESMRPVQGVHTPDVGPGGSDIDTGDPASRAGPAGTT